MTTGMFLVFPFSFRCFRTSYPSISGIITSSKIRSGVASPDIFSASRPLLAARGTCPKSERISSSNSLIGSSSSTTRTFATFLTTQNVHAKIEGCAASYNKSLWIAIPDVSHGDLHEKSDMDDKNETIIGTTEADATKSLKGQTRILQSIIESIGDGLIVVDEEGYLIHSNPAADFVVGFSGKDEGTGRIRLINPVEGNPSTATGGFYLPDMKTPYPNVQSPLMRAVHGESTNAADIYFLPSKSAQGTWLSVTARPVVDESGAIRGGVAVFRDVTMVKQAEEALKSCYLELETLHSLSSILAQPASFEERLTRILEEIARAVEADAVSLRQPNEDGTGLRLVGSVGLGLAWEQASKVIGFGSEMSARAYESGQVLLNNDFSGERGELPTPSLDTGQAIRSGVTVPVKSSDATLGVITVVSSNPNHFTPDRVDLIKGVVNGMWSLLDNARLYEEIAVKDELASRQNNFINIAAHELRTPLTVVMGTIEVLKRRYAEDDQAKRRLDKAHRSAQRIGYILTELLNTSRLQPGKLSVNPGHMELGDLVRVSLAEVEQFADQHEIVCDIPEDLPKVYADRDKLTQVDPIIRTAVRLK